MRCREGLRREIIEARGKFLDSRYHRSEIDLKRERNKNQRLVRGTQAVRDKAHQGERHIRPLSSETQGR